EQKRVELDDQLARRTGEIARSGLRDDEHVLEAHAADRGVVHAGLDRDDVASDERHASATSDARRLVDLEADAVTEPVDESFWECAVRLRTVLLPGTQRVVTRREDHVLDHLVDGATGDAGTE